MSVSVCLCIQDRRDIACVYVGAGSQSSNATTHTHTHALIYLYVQARCWLRSVNAWLEGRAAVPHGGLTEEQVNA